MIGMLQFKSSKDFNNQSFQTTKEQYSIKDSNNKRYKILKLFRNEFKIRWSRDFPENCDYKTITISYKNGNFYVSFNISYENNSIFNNKNWNNFITIYSFDAQKVKQKKIDKIRKLLSNKRKALLFIGNKSDIE